MTKSICFITIIFLILQPHFDFDVFMANTSLIWDSHEWKALRYSAEHPKNQFALRQLRQEVYHSTLRCVRFGGYTTESGEEVVLQLNPNIQSETVFYKKRITPKLDAPKYDMKVDVLQKDCLTVARQLVEEYGSDKVCVLNMANRHNPGGGVFDGIHAQEEYLFRCSDYYRSLYQYVDFGSLYDVPRAEQSYPLDQNFGGVFTRGVTVFRDNEATGYKLLEEPWHVNFVAVGCVTRPKLCQQDGEWCVSDKLLHTVRNKIKTIFRIAVDNHQEAIVLSVLGCGIHQDLSGQTANMFSEIVHSEEFEHAFKHMVFVVKGACNGVTCQTFKNCFGGQYF